jgi:hypothetical protein
MLAQHQHPPHPIAREILRKRFMAEAPLPEHRIKPALFVAMIPQLGRPRQQMTKPSWCGVLHQV